MERHLHLSLLPIKENFIHSQLQNNRTINRDPKHALSYRLRNKEKICLFNSLILLATSWEFWTPLCYLQYGI